MEYFIINLTDSADLDQPIPVDAEESGDIGCAAHSAVDEALSDHGQQMELPLFVDIHRAENFPRAAPFHAGARKLHPISN